MIREGEVVQVLVLFEEKNALDYGLALWAALHEVEQFYKPAAPNLVYRRYFVSPVAPEPSVVSRITRTLGQIFVNAPEVAALDSSDRRSIKPISKELKAEDTAIVDQNRLYAAVCDVIDQTSGVPMLIVTDRAIVPPAGWRYIIWDAAGEPWSETVMPRSIVLSAAPLDPLYWRETDADRIATVKSRARAAALSITGSMLAIKRCKDRDCFMFNPVSSVLTLDGMRRFGRGHDRPELEGRHFDTKPCDPAIVEPVIATEPPR
jgi:hypothetical protein